MSETLYIRMSTQNIVCSQCQMNTCHTSFREREREIQRQRQRDRETETENSNSKTLFYTDCSLGSVKTCPTTSPC